MWQETCFQEIVKFKYKQLTKAGLASGRELLTVDSVSPFYKESG